MQHPRDTEDKEGRAMKRFTSDDRNEQGRELIPARRNGEVAPLGPSFEGVAGHRTFSRRQALGLLGSSLAGATLLSSGLAGPAKGLTATSLPFTDGDHIALECLGHLPGPRFLDGRTQDGTVGLAPTTGGHFTGTRWKVIKLRKNQISLECFGHLPGPRFLDGRTQDGTVGLAPNTSFPFTGTRWRVAVLPR
jgi:hypothetical protein